MAGKYGVIMSEQMRVDEFLAAVLEITQPLDPFEMPLLDAHGAIVASDVTAGERLVLKAGTLIQSRQIGLAASIGLSRLPTRPHPRVVVLSAGPDLVEPGMNLQSDEEYETNSWLLTTAVREVGAVAYRVHSIPDDESELRAVIEDQLVRADLVIISGERHDDSYLLIYRTLQSIGEMREVDLAIADSGRHCFGKIGPDHTPVVVLPGDPIAAYISFELFVRPMIRQMMGATEIHRPSVKARLEKKITTGATARSYLPGLLSDDNQLVTVLPNHNDPSAMANANCLVAIPDGSQEVAAGTQLSCVILQRSYSHL
jgi:molybdopterin biosynthesis enzyme